MLPPEAPAGAITVSEADGVRYLHFGTEWSRRMQLAHPSGSSSNTSSR